MEVSRIMEKPPDKVLPPLPLPRLPTREYQSNVVVSPRSSQLRWVNQLIRGTPMLVRANIAQNLFGHLKELKERRRVPDRTVLVVSARLSSLTSTGEVSVTLKDALTHTPVLQAEWEGERWEDTLVSIVCTWEELSIYSPIPDEGSSSRDPHVALRLIAALWYIQESSLHGTMVATRREDAPSVAMEMSTIHGYHLLDALDVVRTVYKDKRSREENERALRASYRALASRGPIMTDLCPTSNYTIAHSRVMCGSRVAVIDVNQPVEVVTVRGGEGFSSLLGERYTLRPAFVVKKRDDDSILVIREGDTRVLPYTSIKDVLKEERRYVYCYLVMYRSKENAERARELLTKLLETGKGERMFLIPLDDEVNSYLSATR